MGSDTTMTATTTAWLPGSRCPRCGATLLIKSGHVWCSYIHCTYGLDAPQTLTTHRAELVQQEASHG